MTRTSRPTTRVPVGHPGGRRPRDDAGQVTTALVLVVFLALLSFALYGVFGLSRAADDRTRAQSAADAAALAGAGSLNGAANSLLGLLRGKSDLATVAGCGLGQDRAESYAGANGAHLTDYCFDLGAGRVRAVVRMDHDVTRDSGPAEAGAVASLGFGFGDCTWVDDPPPSPSPTPTPSETATGGPGPSPSPSPTPPPPPPDLGTTLTCGPLHATFLIGGVDGLLHLQGVTIDDYTPRLVD